VPGLALAVAGDGPLRAELERRAARRGLPAAGGRPAPGQAWGDVAVRFLGSFARVPDLLRCADVLAQPSAFEGLPLAVLEGMAAGLPVVVTDTVGTNETVEHERSGLVVPPDDPPAMARALVRLLRDPEQAAEYGVAARRRAERHFSAPDMARRTLVVYRRVLATTGAAREAAGASTGAVPGYRSVAAGGG
jgi:glycosyltransferase involved in cell wall biosynthesis